VKTDPNSWRASITRACFTRKQRVVEGLLPVGCLLQASTDDKAMSMMSAPMPSYVHGEVLDQSGGSNVE
jgi:hypothetical protein